MGVLVGLSGVKKKELPCEFFSTPLQMKKIIAKGMAATSASRNGALNVWQDDKGVLRGSYHQFCQELESNVFESMDDLLAWTKKYLRKIK